MTRCRKRWVRSSRGADRISAGGPCSRMTPASRKQIAVGDVAGEAHLVRGEDHRHALVRQLADDVEHLGHQLGVERGGDLVEQQHVGLHGQCAHDRRSLLLAAR